MSKRTGLGRGLGAFFGNDYEDAEAGKSSAKPSDEAGKKTSVRETEQEIEKKSLEELDMVLPGSKKQKKSASAGKTAAKTVGKGSRTIALFLNQKRLQHAVTADGFCQLSELFFIKHLTRLADIWLNLRNI